MISNEGLNMKKIVQDQADMFNAVLPLTPPNLDLTDTPCMMVDINRLLNSEFDADCNAVEWRAGVTLWLRAFHEVPAGSLPDDDRKLARKAGFGSNTRGWLKAKAKALRGWVKCTDGRLYHPVVCGKALEMLLIRLEARRKAAIGNARMGRSSGDQVALELEIESAARLLLNLDERHETAKKILSLQQKERRTASAQRNAVRTPSDTLSVRKEKEKEKERDSSPSTESGTRARGQAAPVDDGGEGNVVVLTKGAPDDHPRYVEVANRVGTILANPNVFNFRRVDAWLKDGADPEKDIYPTIEALKSQLRGRSLTFFDNPVMSAKAEREKPLPQTQTLQRSTRSFQANSNGRVEVHIATDEERENDFLSRADTIRKGLPSMRTTIQDIHLMISRGLISKEDAKKGGYYV